MRAFGASLALPAATPAWSQFRVQISGVGETRIPIVIGRFRDEDQAPQSISSIVRADLERSGMFRIVDGPAPTDETGAPDYDALRLRGADAVVGGSAARLADGRYDVRFRLWDVVKGADQGGQSEPALPADLRLAAHHVADLVYQKLTGQKGIFSTRIAFVTRAAGTYSLVVTDADGENPQTLRRARQALISPAWSPSGNELAYVSFEEHRKAVVYLQSLRGGAPRVLANFRGSNSSPFYSPDGTQLLVTLSKDGGSHVFLMGRSGGSPVRLTQGTAIDTEARFTPDGRTIYFVSDRGGGPQVYRQPVSGGPAERVTFSGDYNISPALSPDGKLLAYITRQNGFHLMLLDLVAGGDPIALTDTNDDESPSFAPNGRYILYSTNVGGRDSLMTTTVDGRFKAVLGDAGHQYNEPVWGPFGR